MIRGQIRILSSRNIRSSSFAGAGHRRISYFGAIHGRHGGIATYAMQRWQQSYYHKIFLPEVLSLGSKSATAKILSTSSKIKPRAPIVKRLMRKLRALATMLLNAILVAWRSGEIMIRFSPLIILTPAAILNATANGNGKNDNYISDVAWNYSLYTIQQLGPAFIKLCQWAGKEYSYVYAAIWHYLALRMNEINLNFFSCPFHQSC